MIPYRVSGFTILMLLSTTLILFITKVLWAIGSGLVGPEHHFRTIGIGKIQPPSATPHGVMVSQVIGPVVDKKIVLIYGQTQDSNGMMHHAKIDGHLYATHVMEN